MQVGDWTDKSQIGGKYIGHTPSATECYGNRLSMTFDAPDRSWCGHEKRAKMQYAFSPFFLIIGNKIIIVQIFFSDTSQIQHNAPLILR